MWWLDPGKEVLNVIFNRVLAPYVENLDMSQVSYGIAQGELTLRNLRMKKGALDKFRLPVDVIEGHLGKFSMNFHWRDLGNKPVEVVIEEVYLLVVSTAQNQSDPEEDEQRQQEAKAERLENAELLHMRAQTDVNSQESQQNQGLIASITAKILNNLQVTVKNIHIRYEDNQSCPGHPFAAGLTLAGFTAFSTNEEWKPTFIESTAGSIHKLSNLESLAVYFDTDSESLAGLPPAKSVKAFGDMISKGEYIPNHQFVLKPVTGEGRIVMNHKLTNDTPRFDVQLLFDEIGFVLDKCQYRDTISLVDMYHFYARQHQYRKYRPEAKEFEENRSKALFRFAGRAILDGVREKNRKWTWAFFQERRDDRNQYVELFKQKLTNALVGTNLTEFQRLERKLSYEDIRFYRSIARSQLKKDLAAKKKIEEENQRQQPQARGWTSWIWGSSNTENPPKDTGFGGTMTDQQRKELYEALDYNEKAAVAESLVVARDAMKARVVAKLKRGSLALKNDPHTETKELISLVFDVFSASFVQRPDNFEASISLGDFRVFDGTTPDTLYNQIVHVKDSEISPLDLMKTDLKNEVEPFFSMKFENNPLDERADSGLSVYMRSMEIIYHKGYVEAVYEFFKPPDSQLRSVEALLNVASETLEGLRKETRAGLEYALQTHKTVDIRMDMHAPIIIVPESVQTEDCRLLVVDAGQISIESQLADKKALREVHLKRNQKYTEEDYKQLESLMYDKFSVRLEAAQFVIGDSLQACRNALESNEIDQGLHLVERINIDLAVQKSIVPTARSLTRFKVSGKLPTLQVNFSDIKYKSLMSLIDVAIPHFGDEDKREAQKKTAPPQQPNTHSEPSFKLSSGLFGQGEVEYNVEEDDEKDAADTGGNSGQFFESEDGSAEASDIHQHLFEFNFQVDALQAAISKSTEDSSEKRLGDIRLDRFALAFALAQYDMKVDIKLRSLSMNLLRPGMKPIPFVSSAEIDRSQDADLMSLTYTRVQPASPEFMTVYEGINQNVDMKLSTFIFQAAPEPVLSLYDFIMTTFVPEKDSRAVSAQEHQSPDAVGAFNPVEVQAGKQDTEKIRVLIKLASVQVLLINGTTRLATLSLSTADVAIMLHANTLMVTTRLGKLLVTDDSDVKTKVSEFKQILSIEGEDFAEFRYQTFNSEDKETYTGIKSSVYLKAGSLKFHFLEQPLHDIYLFLAKLAKLKGLYDAATQAAAQKASEIERMSFDISVNTPILIFPAEATTTRDILTMRLGQIIAHNTFHDAKQNISASLHGIQLTSTTYLQDEPSVLKIIDDVGITTEITQTSGIDRNHDFDLPDYQVVVQISDVKFYLTQVQYCRLISLSQAVPRVLTGAPEGEAQAEHISSSSTSKSFTANDHENDFGGADLQPELRRISPKPGKQIWTSVDLVLSVNAVKLHLYDGSARREVDLKEHGISRFALNQNTLRFKMLSDGALEAEFIIKSFTMSNTRPGPSKFREIIPAAQNDRNQFMLLYTMSGGAQKSAVAVMTVDTPQIIFAIDPMFALSSFFLSAFQKDSRNADESATINNDDPSAVKPNHQSQSLDFRIDLHDVSISVLENDSDGDSQAIQLSVKQIFLSQQGILALTVNRLGMSLMRMGKKSDSVRFLDDVDITVSLDSRNSYSQQMTSIEMTSQPIVFRASYRDINLIMSIVNKAIGLLAKSNGPAPQNTRQIAFDNAASDVASASKQISTGSGSSRARTRTGSLDAARVVMSKEHLKASFDGFRLVLIGDLHELPMLHLETKPFMVSVKDWSSEFHAATTIATSINYWNLKNSHWEPLIDPWAFSVTGKKETPGSGLAITLSSQERLDVNLSTTFVELAISTANLWSKEGDRVLQKARGSYAPYRIRNRTGTTINVWSDVDGSTNSKDSPAIKIIQGQIVDWRFDDWKTMREHVSSSGHNSIGVQFDGKPWEQLRSIPVDREGEYTFSLRPRTEKFYNKLMCEITIEDNVKIVTLRSTYKVENQTLYPLEITLVDNVGHPVYALEKIAPGQDYALPIEAVAQNRIRIQPDQGFGYKWSAPIRWEDLMNNRQSRGLTIRCPHTNQAEAPFRFQVWPVKDSNVVGYPKLTLKLRAPIELENLLPYDVQYKVYDRDSDQNWSSYLRKGGIMPVHSVELGHLVLLNITVQDASFKPSDFAIINTDGKSDFDVENQLSIQDSQGLKLDLKLNYVKYPDSGGAFKVQVYCPYVVMNKTGLPFSVNSLRSTRAGAPRDVAGGTSADELSKSTPFMLSHSHPKGNEFIFKVGDSMWSKTVSFEAPSAESAIVMPSTSQKSEIHVGLSWAEGLGKYKLTKVITLAPRFYVKNMLSEALCFREHGVPPGDRSELGPGERYPLHFMRLGQEKLLTVAYPGLDAQWSTPINMEDIGSIHVRMRPPGSKASNDVHLIVADIVIEGATIFIMLSREKGPWPFVIENNSDHELSFGQTDDIRDRPEPQFMYNLQPRTRIPYAWDYPAAREKRIYLRCDDHARKIDIMEIGNLPPLKLQYGSRALSLDVRADGPTQLLSVTNYEEEVSLYKLKRRNTGSISRQDTISSTQDFEAVQQDVPPNLIITVDAEGLGISLMNKKLVEVVYFTINNLKLEYSNSPAAQAMNVSCGVLQIDNQLHDAQFPVLLQPTPITREARGIGALPTVQASIIVLNDSAHGVLFVKYASILLQAITVQIDEAFLYAVLDLTKFQGVYWEAEPENVLIQHMDDVPEPTTVKGGQDVYFEVLELQPIILSVSFVRNITSTDDDSQKLTTRNPLAVVLNALTMALGNLGDARLELNALGLKDVRLTLPDIQGRIVYHYRQEILRQLYRLLGSADFLGNPVGLFTNVSSGVADIFYEPWHGVVMHGNKELGIGIAKGAASFVKKTVFGLSDSMTKVTSSLGKGLSAATFDTEYQNKRRMTQRRNKPRHAIYGVTAGAEALANSLASGVEGVVMKPIEGAETEGALGFFKGMGKGIVGAVTKPVVGVFDLASNVSEGIRNTTTVFDNPERDRVRKPRLVPADGVLQPYAAREALGQYWMRDLENGEYRKEFYVAHINIPDGDNVVLLTANRVLSFWSTRLRLVWDLSFNMVQGVTIEDTGVRFASKAGREQDRFVFIQDKSSQIWFFNAVASVVKSFNAQRRIER